MSKTFIVPVGAAVAALLAGVCDEAKAHVGTYKESSPRQESTNTDGESQGCRSATGDLSVESASPYTPPAKVIVRNSICWSWLACFPWLPRVA